MKSKNFVTFFFIAMGVLGCVLLIFGLQFNGTLCDEIQMAGLLCIGLFAAWGIFNLISARLKQKALEKDM